MANNVTSVLHMVSWYNSVTLDNPTPTFHTELCMELSKSCNVAIYYPYERNLDMEFMRHEQFGLITYRSKYQLEKKMRNRLYMYRSMKRIIADFHPDIIHGHVGTEAGRFATTLGRLFHIPVVITEHSSADLSGVRSFPHHQYAWLTYRLSDYNACVSDALTADLSSIFPKYEFNTIYNGIIIPEDIEQIACSAPDYRVPDRINAVMVAGMYDKHIKGIDILIPILTRLKDEGINISMHFVGDGDYKTFFEDLAKDNDVSDICIFHGWKSRNEVLSIVSQMDFLISASRYESFGCSMAEAAMMGTPVLATDSGGSRSIVNSDNGILITEYSEEAIYNGIKDMVNRFNSFDSKSFAKAAREKFSISAEAARYMDVYSRLMLRSR